MDPETDAQAFAAATALDAFNRGDVVAYLDLFADDMDFWLPGTTKFSGRLKGKDAFMGLGGRLAAEIDGLITLTLDHMVAGGDWVVTQTQGAATTGDGQAYNNTYCHLWQVRDGRIVSFTEYCDTDLVRRSFDHN